MTEANTRAAVGIFLVFPQILVILFAVGVHIRGGLKFDELTTAIGLIVPMFAVHTAAISKYFATHRTDVDRPGSKVTWTFALLAFLTPVIFVAYLLGVITVKALGVAFGAPEQFKWALGIGETCFAVYLGTFIGTLFNEHAPSARSGTKAHVPKAGRA